MKLLLSAILLVFTFASEAQITRQWSAYFNGSGDFNDRFTCMAQDAAGNVFLAGSTNNPDADRDFLLQKLAPAGTVLWTWQMDGPGHAADEVRAIATDASGNVYLTGLSQGDNTGEDYLTVKLSPAGDTLWTRRYDFTGEFDQPNSLSVDNDGNVWVTGQSDSDPSANINNDYATLKYAANGATLWVKRFNGLGNGTDEAVAVVTDANGNGYVTGRSSNGDNDDYLTLRYEPNGALGWARFDDRLGRDRATAMTLDADDNLLLTGRSSNGDNDDYWTLKINTDGDLLWDKVYDFVDQDRALAITTDPAGNVFVTGQSDKNLVPPTDWDMLTVAYNAAGTELWAKRFDGGVNADDIPAAVAVDGSGHVYVTGVRDINPAAAIAYETVTIRYQASTGAADWTQIITTSGNDDQVSFAALAFSNGCMVAGYTEDSEGRRNAVAYRYGATGAISGQHLFNGTGDNNDNVRALALDGNGGIYAAGYSVGGNNNRDLAVIHFDQQGILLCSRTIEGTAPGGADDATGLAIDASGNPIAAGVLKNSGTSNDIALLKINGLCDSLWTRTLNGPGSGSDRTYDFTKAADGNFYLAGRMDTDPGPLANDDALLAKFDADGTLVWSKTYNSGGTNADRAVKVRVAPSGDVYAAGRSWDGAQYDIFLLKWNNLGVQQWAKSWNGGGNDEPQDMALDPSGNIVIAGTAAQTGADTLHDMITLKYSPSGALVWEKRSDGGQDDRAAALSLDATGNIYVAGQTDADLSSIEDLAAWLVKLSPDGQTLWAQSFNGAAADVSDDVAVNHNDQAILTLHSNTGTAQTPVYDIQTYLLSPAGETLWSDVFDSPAHGSDVPNLILLDGDDFYIAGSSNQGPAQRDILVVKYGGMVSGTDFAENQKNIKVYPNPFDRELRVSGLPETAVFELYDGLGRLLFSRTLTDVSNTVALPADLPDGWYTYRLFTDTAILSSGRLSHTR